MGTAVTAFSCGLAGGGNRDRTGDLLHAMQALSQLSYTPRPRGRIIASYLSPLVTHGPRRRPLTKERVFSRRPCVSPTRSIVPSSVVGVYCTVPEPWIGTRPAQTTSNL